MGEGGASRAAATSKNAAFLSKNSIDFCFTSSDLKEQKEFLPNVRKTIKYGLSKENALKALTLNPATYINAQNSIGSLARGKIANFIICSGDIFEEKTTLYENWVQGSKTVIEDMNIVDIRGDYEFALAGEDFKMSIKGELSKPKSEITSNEKTLGSKITYDNYWVNISMTTIDSTKQEFIRIQKM